MAKMLGVVLLLKMVLLAAGKPTSYKENLIDSDLNKTVEEVVGILGQRQDLPRLTRGEILELVADVRKQKSMEEVKNNEKNQEPLVVVMPFRPNGTSIEDLYTQAPVTQVIGDLATKLASKRPGHKRRRKPIPRPVYVHTDATTQSTTAITAVTETSQVEPVSIIQKIPPKTTPKPTTTEQTWKPLEELVIPDDMKDVIEEISVKRQTAKPVFVTPGTKRPTTKPAVPPEDVSVAAESLSDEMKDLLATFGLLGTKIEKDTPVNIKPKDPYSGFEFGAVKPKVDPNSYISFKPLPDDSGDSTMTPDMKTFLASFGLINERSGRNMKSEISSKQKRSKERDDRTLKEVPKINSEMFSDDMMTVLENLGIANSKETRKAKRLGEHIFNPAQRTAELNRTDQIEKVQKLVTKIKELSANHEIHSLTPSELKELLKTEADLIQLGGDGNLLVKTDTLDNSGGPDPLSLDEIVELLDKNESKRQGSSEEDSSTEENPTISTRRYDVSDGLKLTEGKEDTATKDVEEDSTPEQSTNIVVTTPPEEALSREESSANEDAETSEATSFASATSSAASTGNSSSASSNEVRASSSASSSSSSGEDASSASASASATSSSDGDSLSTSAEATASSGSSESDSQPMAAEGPSFDDLNESFGGEITTTPRPNGLFFLLDWNSFLQVGTDERKVDLSFNPKIGDPRNFYPIRFP